jgi:FtsZ-interacting cell division protein ZipA
MYVINQSFINPLANIQFTLSNFMVLVVIIVIILLICYGIFSSSNHQSSVSQPAHSSNNQQQAPRPIRNVTRTDRNQQNNLNQQVIPPRNLGYPSTQNQNTNYYQENPYGYTNTNNNDLNPYL